MRLLDRYSRGSCKAAGRIRWMADRMRDLPLVIALWVLDRLAGPMPKTVADDIREAERERLRKAFPVLKKHL
jgi:hypothetical protein